MNRKFATGFLIGFVITLLLFISTFFLDFGKAATFIRAFFLLGLFYFLWVFSRKINWKRKINKKRAIIGLGLVILVASFYLSLVRLFFENVFLTVLTYAFFVSFGLFLIFTFYKLYKKKLSDSAKNSLAKVINYMFQILLVAFLLMLLIEEFFYNIVILNLNYFMAVVIALGILSILFPYKEKKKKSKKKPNKYIIYGLGIIGAVLVFIKTKNIGYLSYVVAVISFVLIVLLGSLTYEEDEE